MIRLFNLAKRKKGVSPVIAVVLLIALTVAAAAVIWAITQGLIGGVVSVTISTSDTTSGAPGIWQGTVEASESGTITFRLYNSTHSFDGTITNPASGSGAITGGSETSFTVSFDDGANVIGGSYTLEVTIDVDGEDTIETTKVTF